jgi:hypothetical protein
MMGIRDDPGPDRVAELAVLCALVILYAILLGAGRSTLTASRGPSGRICAAKGDGDGNDTSYELILTFRSSFLSRIHSDGT